MKYNRLQLTGLVLLRVMIGWHLLYEGIIKLTNPDWSALGYLQNKQGIFSGVSSWLTGQSGLVQFIDIINISLLIAAGIGLIAGLFSRIISMMAMILLLLYYLANPPLFADAGPVWGIENSLIINRTLIEAAALFILWIFPTGAQIGLDRFLFPNERDNLS